MRSHFRKCIIKLKTASLKKLDISDLHFLRRIVLLPYCNLSLLGPNGTFVISLLALLFKIELITHVLKYERRDMSLGTIEGVAYIT